MGFSIRDGLIAAQRFAARLARDAGGNTLAMMAAAVIPITGMIGSGLDMSRAYMAQSRLQLACDAGALAGRRVMVNSTVDSNVRAEALKFFRFNFPTGENGTTPPYGVASFTPTVADATDGTVRMTAATTVPTTLMAIFGKPNIPISVTCYARQDFVNTDIVLVLDVTGSMAEDVNGNSLPNNSPNSKMAGLRSAVLALYDELKPVQDQLQGVGLRLRYSIVPYSTTVNAGAAIRSADPNYLISNWAYQSRKAVYDTPIYTAHPGTPTVTVETYPSNLSSSNCKKYGDNTSFSGFTPNDTTPVGTAPQDVTTTTYSRGTWGGSTNMSGNGNKTCTRSKSVVVTSYTFGGGYSFTRWEYGAVTYDVSNFKSNQSITIATNTAGVMPASDTYTLQQMAAQGSGFSTTATTWDGCIEERKTNSSITSTTTSVPSDAYDLDIDLIPNSDDTRWRPIWDNIEYRPNSNTTTSAPCPAEAKRLQSWARADLNTYLDTLDPTGNTYHDIGMIWGGRMLSNVGIFSADNPDTYNSMPVARFLIFMTDGIMQPSATVYSAYGIENLDGRVTGGYTNSNDQTARHNKRLELACQAAKAKGVSIWVISFASSLSTQLTNCASKPSQASVSTNSTDLINKFTEIGKNIGSLRLVQ